MNGRRAVTGLLLLCALVFCAIGASSASAVGMTAYECVKGVSGGLGFKYTDADCETTNSSGEFGHKEILSGAANKINIDTKLVSANYKLNTTVLGLPTEITCTEQTTTGTVENEAGAPMKAKGTATITFKGCVVNKPAKCVVQSPGQPIGTIVVTLQAKSKIVNASPEEHGVEYEPPAGGNFTELLFTNKMAEPCKITNGGVPFPVTGTIIGTGSVASMTGAIQHFVKTETAMQKLKVGPEPATLGGETTVTNSANNNALSLTTTAT